MPERINNHSNKVCDVCGDVGWEEAFLTCCRCNIRRHGYCMRVVTTRILKDWVCEECPTGNDVDSLKFGRTEDVLNTCRKVNFNLQRQVACRGQKAAETGKVKFIPTEEFIKLASGSTKNEFPFMRSFSSKPEPMKFTASPSKTTFPGFKPAGPGMNPIRVRPNPSFLPVGSAKRPGFGDALKSSSISQHAVQKPKESEEKNVPQPLSKKCSRNEEPLSSVMLAKEVKTVNADAKTPISNAGKKVETAPVVSQKENVHKEQIFDVILPDKEHTILHTKTEKALKSSRSLPSRHTNTAGSGQNFPDAFEPKNSSVAERETWNNQLKVSLYLPHVPASRTIWTGGFKFLDTATPGEFYGGFFAQPPCVVHRKAYELSAKMPSLLQVNLLHQCDLRANLFQNGCLDLCDIALYIFPADYIERSQQNYSRLSQLMEKNRSVIRSDMDGVELLIFTSKQLHVDSQVADKFLRSNTDFFGGVFRRAKDNQKLPPLVSPLEHKHDDTDNMDGGEAVDMDIDMVGGQVVRIPDVAVSEKLNGDLNKWAAKETLDATTDGKLSTVSKHLVQPISVDLDTMIQPISVEFKQECCKDSDLPCKSTKKIVSRFTLEHPSESSRGIFPGSLAETDIPPGFGGMLKLSSSSRAPKAPREEEKKDLGGRRIVSQKKEEIGCPGILPVAHGVRSRQPERTIEDSGLLGSKKQSQVLVDDLVNDRSSACAPPPCLSGKGTKVGPVIKAEGPDIEKPTENRETKDPQVSAFFRKGKSHIIATAVSGPCPVEVKSEAQELVNDASSTCPPHVLDKGLKIGLQIQGYDIEKPIETREKKGLQVSSSHIKDEASRVTGSYNAPCVGVVKAEMEEVTNYRANAAHGLYASLASNMVTSVYSLASPRVKLSVAGMARGNLAASAGGLLRDESGKWIIGYNLNLGPCSSLVTDLWALLQGMKLTWDRGYRKVVVEMDSTDAMECLKKPLSLYDSNRALIESCRDLLNCKWDCKVTTITKEENSCANWLAANVDAGQLGSSIIRVPPLQLIPLLENDCKRNDY